MNQKLGMAAMFLLAVSIAAPVMAQGDVAAVYKTKCAMCHGADGKGDTPVGKKMGARAFQSPEVAKESDQLLFDITLNGKAKMPLYKGKLTDDQIKSLVKYIRSLK
jgi:mono/diheme cytochrome c family protein